MSTRVAVNGLGRIGRLVFRQLMTEHDIEVVAVNDIVPIDNLIYLLRYDSVHSVPDAPLEVEDNYLHWGVKKVRFTNIRDPAELPWESLGVDTVIESSGAFREREEAARHLEAGAQRVIISAPAKGEDITLCLGVNEDRFDPKRHFVVSNASCTTNCLAPVAKVLDQEFGIVTGFLTTVHAYTSSQSVVDTPHKSWRRGRAAGVSIVPTTTGAAQATAKVLPQLEGKMNGLAMRVPVADGSIIDFVARTEHPLTVEQVNEAFRKAASTDRLHGILGVTEDPLVSADIVGSRYSALVDARSTTALGEHTVKVLAWYDNEWGYARRVVDLVSYLGRF